MFPDPHVLPMFNPKARRFNEHVFELGTTGSSKGGTFLGNGSTKGVIYPHELIHTIATGTTTAHGDCLADRVRDGVTWPPAAV